MPNALSFLMLLIWPIVTFVMFARMPLERALIWSILGGYLLLPPLVNFDLPLLPPLDKATIPNLSAFAACVLMLGKRVSILPEVALGKLLMVLIVVSPVATVLTNPEPVTFGVVYLPGMTIRDALSVMINQLLFLLPFFLGRRFLSDEKAMREILIALVVAGLIYSVPIVIEARLSPQLNIWIYGFFQHSFEQMVRFGGFRPIVFLYHGLWVAFLVLMTLVSAVALARLEPADNRPRHILIVLWLAAILLLCRSVGPVIYAIGLIPLVLVVKPTVQVRVAAVLALIVVAYPMLRGADVIPVDDMVERAYAFDAARGQSLEFRFDNEAVLLERASEKPLFGWGGYGRNMVFDPETGKSLTVPDGRWIIVIGLLGWVGYIMEFGLLALPLVYLAMQARSHANVLSPYAGVIALILAANMVDLLPNATLIPFTWLMAGAILGYAEALRAGRVTRASGIEPLPEAPPRPRTVIG